MTASLQAVGLKKSYRRRQVVKGVSFEVNPGEIVGLLGPNGAGKTTSFNMVAGILPSDGGTVLLGDLDLGSLPLYRRARLGLGYLPQETTINFLSRLTPKCHIFCSIFYYHYQKPPCVLLRWM